MLTVMTPVSPRIFFILLGISVLAFIVLVVWTGQPKENTPNQEEIVLGQQDLDSDGDGFYDWEEEIAGTDPEDERSTPDIPLAGEISWEQSNVELPRPGQRQDSFTQYRQAFEGVYESISGEESENTERAYIENVSWEDIGKMVTITITGEGFSPSENVVFVGYELEGVPAGIKGFADQVSPDGKRIKFKLPKGAPSEVASAAAWENYPLTARWITVAATDRTPESNQVSFSEPIPLK